MSDIDPRALMAQTGRRVQAAGGDADLFWKQVFNAQSPSEAIDICNNWLRKY
jgi:hypothetical protein